MTDLRTPTDDDELIDKIVAELELLEQQANEQISDIPSLFMHHNRWGNVYLDEVVARLASECAASKSQIKQQHEMILQLQRQLKTLTDIHQIDSQTNVGQQLHQTQGEQQPTVGASSPMNIVTGEIDTGEEQQVEQEQPVQESHQQAKINETNVVMTDEGLLLSDSDHIFQEAFSTQTNKQSQGIESLPKECDEERSDLVTRSKNVSLVHHYESDESGKFSKSLRMTQVTSIFTDDGLPNKITEIERTDQQPEQFKDARHNNHGKFNKTAGIPITSIYPVEFPSVQQLHQTQEEREQTVQASSPMEVEICDTDMNELLPLNVSSQMEQQQEIVSVRDVSSTVEINERSDIIIRSDEQSSIWESSNAQLLRRSTQLQIGEMHTTNNRSPLCDSTQMEQVCESDTVKLRKEERDGGVTLPNISIDVEQRFEQEQTMPSPQMKVRFLRRRKIIPKQIASNSERSKAPPKNPKNARKKSGTHTCGECNKRFISKSHLIIHSRVHTGEKPYVCTDCEVAFSLVHHLKRHQIIHSGEKPYVCTDCGAAFNQTSHLKTHQRIHSGEKPYVYTDCSAAFTVASNLKRHQRIHLDEKPFICGICKTSFRLKRELSLHMRIHSGKKSYKCNVCKKEFSHKITLKKHLQLHSK